MHLRVEVSLSMKIHYHKFQGFDTVAQVLYTGELISKYHPLTLLIPPLQLP